MRLVFWMIILCASAWADQARQVEMLKEVFGQPKVGWESILAKHRSLLDRSFFQNVAERLRWDLREGQFEDAIRFATTGDLALRVLGKPPYFSRKIALAFPDSLSSGLDLEFVKTGSSWDFFGQPKPDPKAFGKIVEPQEAGARIDLSQESDWKLMVAKEVVHRLGEPLGYVPYQLGDHTDWTTGPAEFGNLGLLTTRADSPVSFLQQGEPDFFLDGLWVGSLRGELVWVGSRSPETELYCDGQLVGRLGGSFQNWTVRLGSPDCRFQELDLQSEVNLYRSPMADIGLEVAGDQVTGMILMEPGQLRTNLQRLGRFREI